LLKVKMLTSNIDIIWYSFKLYYTYFIKEIYFVI
jgi:hypothetical protein